MLIRSLRAENFRKFADIKIGDFSDGLNLVCEPNEAGKSTVLEALRAAFFERHGANSERTRSFRPYGSEVAPEVTVVFHAGGQTWTLRKRFLQGPLVILSNGHQRYESDAAEDQLQTLLGLGRPGNRGPDEESTGALGLLWVEQGEALNPVKPADRVKRTLEDLLASEVGAVTGGPEAGAIERAVDSKLAALRTATGRARGDLLAALDEREAAQAALRTAQEKLQGFEDVLQGLEARRGELKRVRRDLEDETLAGHRKSLQADLERARVARASVLAAAEDRLAFAAQRAARIEEEADVLGLLASTIKAARAEATRRYLAPVTTRIAPYLGRLFPGASLSFDEFAPDAITRFGRTEAFGDLSRGTQEQIAVLTRIAFAELMRANNRSAAIVLDDALVWSDDSRFEAMRGILAEASDRMQIIVLTCRASAFRGIAATRLSLGN